MSGVDNEHAHLTGKLVLPKNDNNSVNGGGVITCQLISSTIVDKNNGNRGTVGDEATMDLELCVTFDWDVSEQGIPGAIIVKNNGEESFYLKNITISGDPRCGTIVFLANSWVYPQSKYPYDRVFFANHPYLPSKMPEPLKPYRDDELRNLRGDDQHGPYEEHHRVYRYDVYNDLGNPDGGEELARTTLGGSKHHPYPRRCRTGRKPMNTDPGCEGWVEGSFLVGNVVYVPCDERFGDFKWAEFKKKSILSGVHKLRPLLMHYPNGGEVDSFEDIIYSLYPNPQKAGTKQQVPVNPAAEELRKLLSSPQLKKLSAQAAGFDDPATRDHFGWLQYPKPQIIKEDEKAWMSDDEFAREMLAGVNPVMIKRLTEFPPKSTLDPSKYGDQTSTITEAHIQSNLEGLTVQQALKNNRLYILDHHDHYMPFLIHVNNIDGNFIYATRTLLFLRGNDTLTPVAIELSLPDELPNGGGITAAKSTVYTPKPMPAPTSTSATNADAWVWQLAKAYVNVNDYCWHQGISHWLNTHAVMEPFVIATNRQLSVTHPVHKLLLPHYRDTMKINALARQNLVQADGVFERTTFAGKHALEISSKAYGSWNFTEQALPSDLIKRGMAVEDESSPYKVRLLVKDYPYASDGLAIWDAIEQWVAEYLDLYYPNDDDLKSDVELQEWWKEVREVGHGDLKDEPWWPKMQTAAELTRTCSTIIWIASALHAAVNFGQYPYCGYHPNRPSLSRRRIPDQKLHPTEYKELEDNPELFFVRSITCLPQALLGISLLEVLSSQSPNEVYLGQRDDTPEWTSDAKAQEAFNRFGECLNKIEKDLEAMNNNTQLHNRYGPANFPYTLLFPNTSGQKNAGITARGIPNSVSI